MVASLGQLSLFAFVVLFACSNNGAFAQNSTVITALSTYPSTTAAPTTQITSDPATRDATSLSAPGSPLVPIDASTASSLDGVTPASSTPESAATTAASTPVTSTTASTDPTSTPTTAQVPAPTTTAETYASSAPTTPAATTTDAPVAASPSTTPAANSSPVVASTDPTLAAPSPTTTDAPATSAAAPSTVTTNVPSTTAAAPSPTTTDAPATSAAAPSTVTANVPSTTAAAPSTVTANEPDTTTPAASSDDTSAFTYAPGTTAIASSSPTDATSAFTYAPETTTTAIGSQAGQTTAFTYRPETTTAPIASQASQTTASTVVPPNTSVSFNVPLVPTSVSSISVDQPTSFTVYPSPVVASSETAVWPYTSASSNGGSTTIAAVVPAYTGGTTALGATSSPVAIPSASTEAAPTVPVPVVQSTAAVSVGSSAVPIVALPASSAPSQSSSAAPAFVIGSQTASLGQTLTVDNTPVVVQTSAGQTQVFAGASAIPTALSFAPASSAAPVGPTMSNGMLIIPTSLGFAPPDASTTAEWSGSNTAVPSAFSFSPMAGASTTHHKGVLTITGSPTTMTIGLETISRASNGAYMLGTATLTPGQTLTTISGTQTAKVALTVGPNGMTSLVVVDASTTGTVALPAITSASKSASSQAVVVNGHTYYVGGDGMSLNAQATTMATSAGSGGVTLGAQSASGTKKPAGSLQGNGAGMRAVGFLAGGAVAGVLGLAVVM
ncbi:hypothetical protein LTR62_004547 [Meristemomyces frigidus]|uniref:Uncharacterized protein n=1 Tax=Meristemomyces frigidus TaxID=1508187 RepID=A0AAN7THC0_9PEZI|nr:hypothetical protein LTR62_004547 [Meristemomyces frigidus]